MTLIQTNVYDTSGNNNGIIDPGETVELTAVLRNIGGVDFTDLAAVLTCSDPYVTIPDDSAYFGYLAVDSTRENVGDPYAVTASTSTPQGHSAEFMLIAADGSFIDTFTFDLVIGGVDYLIWNPDPTPVSGQLIDYVLTGLGYAGGSTSILPVSDLQTYKAIYVCAGIYPHNYVISALGPEGSALADYVNSGGCMYLEGGEVWYYDPTAGGYNFCPLFGIHPTSDGAGTVGPVVGQPGTFTQGMFFYYAGENYSIDQIEPTGSSAALIFYDDDNGYGCGVSNDAATYKTVGTSFELGALVDLGGVSTRAVLLDSIMHFFGISPTSIEEHMSFDVYATSLIFSPNPFTGIADITWQIADNRVTNSDIDVSLKIYDPTGRLVRDFGQMSLNYHQPSIKWDGTDNSGQKIPSGVYFVRLTISVKGATGSANELYNNSVTEKVLLIK